MSFAEVIHEHNRAQNESVLANTSSVSSTNNFCCITVLALWYLVPTFDKDAQTCGPITGASYSSSGGLEAFARYRACVLCPANGKVSLNCTSKNL